MARKKVDESEVDKLKRAMGIYRDAAAKFAENERKITSIASSVFKSLLRNSKYFDADGSRRSGSWWMPLPPSSDHILIDLRDFVFRCHLFENGVRWMIEEMSEAKLLTVEGDELEGIVKLAIDYEAMAIHHELMGYVASKKSNPVINLADATKRYNLTHPPRLRDSRAVPMAQLGMWKCEADKTRHEIALGLPARIFHEKTFAPIKRAFDPANGTFDAKLARGYHNGSSQDPELS